MCLSNALVQDAAYDLLLRSSRQKLHLKVAQLLKHQSSTVRTIAPELLAHHFSEAGSAEEAFPMWYQAAKTAIAKSANIEAISHLSKGLQNLLSLPDDQQRILHELELNTLLGNTLMAIKGYAAQEVRGTFDRARQLCDRLGETPRLLPVLRGLWMYYLVRADLKSARKLAEQMLQITQQVDQSSAMLEAHRSMGMTFFFLGDFGAARCHLEKGISLYRPEEHREHAVIYGTDPGVACLCYAAANTWVSGYPDRALDLIQDGLKLAERNTHSFSRSFALFFAAMIHQYRRELDLARETAEADIALCREGGICPVASNFYDRSRLDASSAWKNKRRARRRGGGS